MGTITAAVTSLKTAGELALGLVKLKTMTEVQSVAIELNSKIIDAQYQVFAANAAQTELVERVRALESQIARMKDWDTQKQRYHLASPFPGCMVQALLKSMSSGEPPHYLCTACFERGERSILQGREGRQTKEGKPPAAYHCPICKSEAQTSWGNVEPPQYFEEITPQG
jgi:rubrerythrin